MADPTPYSSSPVFTEETLPDALKRKHCTKRGVWGVVRVTKGEVMLQFEDGTEEQLLSPGRFGLLLPDQLHWVSPMGKCIMQIDFYREPPRLENIVQA